MAAEGTEAIWDGECISSVFLLETFHFSSHGPNYVTVLGHLPQSEMCLPFAHKALFCPGDELISLLPSLLLNKRT